MDIAKYLQTLSSNTEKVVDLLHSSEATELNFKSQGRWNLLEIGEHLILTERVVCKLLFAPSDSRAGKEELHGEERLNRMLVGMRSRKIVTPEIFEPKGEIKDPGTFEKKFREQRQMIIDGIKTDRIKIDDRVQKHPVLGEMTISDWLYFLPQHAARHLEQMKDNLQLSRAGQ